MTNRRALLVVAGLLAAAAIGYGFVTLNDELGEARARIDALEDALEMERSEVLRLRRSLRDTTKEMTGLIRRARERVDVLSGLLDQTVCFADRRPLRDGFYSGTERGDVDGDGKEDVIRTLGRPTRDGDCRYLLKVRTDEGIFTEHVRHEDPYGLKTYFQPRLLVDLNDVGGSEIVVDVGRGAYAEIAQIFTLNPGRLTPLRGFGSREIWIAGASAGNGSAFGCLEPHGGSVFYTTWQYADDPRRHDILRRFFRVEGDTATLTFTERRTMRLPRAFRELEELAVKRRFARCRA